MFAVHFVESSQDNQRISTRPTAPDPEDVGEAVVVRFDYDDPRKIVFITQLIILTNYSTGNHLPFWIPHPHQPSQSTHASELLARDDVPNLTELCKEINFLQSDVQALKHCVQDIKEFVEGVQKERSIDISLMAELEKEWNRAYQMVNTTTNHGIAHLDRQMAGIWANMVVVNKESRMSSSRLAAVDNRATAQQKELEWLKKMIEEHKALEKKYWQQLWDTESLMQKQLDHIRVLKGTVMGQQHMIGQMDQCYQMVAKVGGSRRYGTRSNDWWQGNGALQIEGVQPGWPHNDTNPGTWRQQWWADRMNFLNEDLLNQEDANHKMDTDETPKDNGENVEVQVIPPTPTRPIVGQAPNSLTPTHDALTPLPAIAEDVDIPGPSMGAPLDVPLQIYEHCRSPRLITDGSVPPPVAPVQTRRRNTVTSRLSCSPRPTTPLPSAPIIVHGSPDERVDFEGSPWKFVSGQNYLFAINFYYILAYSSLVFDS